MAALDKVRFLDHWHEVHAAQSWTKPMSRVRPRPVDVTKQLEIVRDESLLDIVEGTPGPEAGPLEVKTEASSFRLPPSK